MDKPISEEKRIPHNLPARIQTFVDREKEIQQVTHALLDPYIPMVTVTGIGGIGKTALALEVTHRLLEQGQFAGGICWLDCQGSDKALDAFLRTIQATFGIAPVPTLHEEVRRYLRTYPCLLVLDGYETVAQDMGILAFLERLPDPSKALLASKESIRLHRGIWTLALEGLTTQDAVRLFMETADRYGLKVLPEQIPVVAEICQLLDASPLLIRHAALVSSNRLEVLHQALVKQPTASYETILDHYTGVRTAEQESFDVIQWRQAALRRFRHALATDDDNQILASYDPILDGSTEIRASEQQRLELAQRRQAELWRFRHALATDDDNQIVANYSPFLDSSTQISDGERRRVELARQRIQAQVHFRRFLTTNLANELDQVVGCYQYALALSLTPAPPIVLETARQVVEFGKQLVAQDKVTDALTVVNRLGDVLDNVEMEASAKVSRERPQVIRESVAAYQTSASSALEAIQVGALLKDTLAVIASVASVRIDGSAPAQYDRALQAWELARQVDKATGGIFELAQWVRAASGYEFVELEEVDRWPPRLAYLVHLAARYEWDENWGAAIDTYRQARALLDPNKGEEELKRYTEIGFRLGLCLKQDGRWSEALKQQEENVASYKKLGNPYGKASTYLEMGHIYEMMNIYDLALLYYGEAYYLYQQAVEEARDEAARQLAQRGMADAKDSLGQLEFQLKVLPKAFTDLEEAEKLYTALGMPGKADIIRQTLENAQVPAGGSHD